MTNNPTFTKFRFHSIEFSTLHKMTLKNKLNITVSPFDELVYNWVRMELRKELERALDKNMRELDEEYERAMNAKYEEAMAEEYEKETEDNNETD